MTDTENVRFLNSVNGTMGCSSRCSTKKNTTQATAEKRSRPITSSEKMSWSRVIENATSIGTRATASRTAPTKSMSRHEDSWRVRGMKSTTATTARMPTGTFT